MKFRVVANMGKKPPPPKPEELIEKLDEKVKQILTHITFWFSVIVAKGVKISTNQFFPQIISTNNA